MLRSLLYRCIPAVAVLWAATDACAQVVVTPVNCGLQLTYSPVPNAARYRVSRVYAYCQNVIRRPEFVIETTATQCLLTSNPAFVGNFKVEAFGPLGGPLGVQESDIGTPLNPTVHPAVGAPWIPTGSSMLGSWVGERLELEAVDVPAGIAIQWTRNGVAIPGATALQLAWTVGASDEGAVFAPMTSNACGTHFGYATVLTLAPAPPAGVVEWVSIRRQATTSGGACVTSCAVCCAAWSSTQRFGHLQSSCIQPNASGFTVNCGVGATNGYNASNGNVTRLRFRVTLPSIVTLSGTNAVTTSQGGAIPCGSVSGVLSGPVNVVFPSAVGPWGPISAALPVGEYTATIQAASSGGCGGGGSGSSCGGSSVMSVSAAVAPLPYTVPTTYPTIQSAIDALSAGQAAVITVAPGVYRESISLSGKNVVVLGSPLGETILDGEGLPSSIVRFSGGEPATAGIENLTLRSGRSGSRLFPKADFFVGGALLGTNSSAFVRRCRFQGCAADYGGAAYIYSSRSQISGCTFEDNTALSEGGGLFLYESSVQVVDCVFAQNVAGVSSPGAGSGFKAVGARTAGEFVELSGCAFSGNQGSVSAAAIEFYENTEGTRGGLRISSCLVASNLSGTTAPIGAAGLRVFGSNSSCVIGGNTSICSNEPSDVAGPFIVDGPATVCGCFADFSNDGIVDSADIAVLLGAWGSAPASGLGDVNHDGVVNAADVSALLARWGECAN
jgi:Right handed beta helix region